MQTDDDRQKRAASEAFSRMVGRIKRCRKDHDEDTEDDPVLERDIGLVGAVLKFDFAIKQRTRAIAFMPDGKTFLTGSTDGTVREWNATTGVCKRTLRGHLGFVPSVAVSADGKTIVSGADDGKVLQWHANTGTLIRTLVGGRAGIVAVSRDGSTIASGCSNATVCLWDGMTGARKHGLAGHDKYGITGLAFSPDGTTIASAGEDGAWIWDVESGKHLKVLRHQFRVDCMAMMPDGKILVTVAAATMRVFDIESGKCVRLMQPDRKVGAVAISPDSRFIVSGSDDGTLWVWDAATGQLLMKRMATDNTDVTPATQPVYTNEPYPDTAPVHAIAISPDSATIVYATTNDDTIRARDAATGKVKRV